MSKEAMKLEKIMEQAQVFASAWSLVGGRFDSGNMLDEAEAAKKELRQMVAEALAQQPARPYRQLQDNGSKYFGDSWDKAEQPAQQEPVECANGCRGFVKHSPPAQRPWVGLTDEEISKMPAWIYSPDQDGMTAEEGLEVFARAIEAKLRSKNEDRN